MGAVLRVHFCDAHWDYSTFCGTCVVGRLVLPQRVCIVRPRRALWRGGGRDAPAKKGSQTSRMGLQANMDTGQFCASQIVEICGAEPPVRSTGTKSTLILRRLPQSSSFLLSRCPCTLVSGSRIAPRLSHTNRTLSALLC